MLQETSHEMSLIAFEKKQLLQQWKGALIGLKRRDEALASAQDALKAAEASTRCAKKIKQRKASSAFVGEQLVLRVSKLPEITPKQHCYTIITLEHLHVVRMVYGGLVSKEISSWGRVFPWLWSGTLTSRSKA